MLYRVTKNAEQARTAEHDGSGPNAAVSAGRAICCRKEIGHVRLITAEASPAPQGANRKEDTRDAPLRPQYWGNGYPLAGAVRDAGLPQTWGMGGTR